MDQKTETIITQLKNALERQEPGTNDHQWIMGISINDDRKQCVIVRVVLKTNESPYVDGMDILFDKTNDQLTMDPNYYQNSPDFMGGTVNTRGRFYCALFWLKNTEESVWKRFRWWLQFPAFVCFQSVAPVSAQLNSLKNLNSPTNPIFFVLTTEPTNPDCSASRSVGQCQSIRTRVPMVPVSELQCQLSPLSRLSGKTDQIKWPSPISKKTVPDFPTIIGSLNQTPILNTYYNCEDHWLKQSMVFNTFLEEPSMATLEQKIIEELKLALEYQEPTGDYAQWLMGVSLPSVIERKNDQLVITARVVVKTSDSEYVDGMDIAFSLEPIIDPNYYQNSPDYHGGSIEDSQPWLKKHGKVILEQMDNPFEAGSLKDLLVDELNQLENNLLESRCSK